MSQARRSGDKMNDAFNNPWTQIGLGILGASGPGTNAAQSIGRGGLMGLQDHQNQMQSQAELDMQRMKSEQESAAMAARSRWAASQGYDPNAPDWAMQKMFDQRFQKPDEPKMVKGADGFNYWITGPKSGQRVLPGIEMPDAGPDVEGEGKLRGEFIKQTNDFALMNDAYGRIQAAAESPDAAGDMALIFSYMKMLDPNSTVREGEYATAQDAGSIPARIIGMYNAAINGQKLAPDVRKGFVNRSDILYKKAKTDYEKREQTYRNLAKAYGLDPERSAPSRALYDVKESKKNVESKKSAAK